MIVNVLSLTASWSNSVRENRLAHPAFAGNLDTMSWRSFGFERLEESIRFGQRVRKSSAKGISSAPKVIAAASCAHGCHNCIALDCVV